MSSAAKAELKAAIYMDLGKELKEVREAERAAQYRKEGAAQAHEAGAKACLALQKHVDTDVEEKKYDLETAKVVKLYVDRCAQICKNLSASATNGIFIHQGRVSGTDKSLEVLEKKHRAEIGKLERLAREAEEEKEKAAKEAPKPEQKRPARKKAASRKKKK